jgi:sec-independent protein translocase protein TatC
MPQDAEELRAFDEHLEELVTSLKRNALVFLVVSAASFLLSNNLLLLMQEDISVGMNALAPFEVMNVRLSLALLLGLVGTLPSSIYSVISFARPGLKENEYRTLRNFLPFSYILFVGGSLFAYQFIFKNALNFFVSFTEGASVDIVWGLQNTVMLGFRLSLLTGLLFQLPIMVLILNKSGLVGIDQLRRYRAHVVIGILIISAIATPPDILTQVMITLPVFVLYQLSILMAEYF